MATFTIPKILSSQQNAQKNAITKDTMATLSVAYQQLQLSNTTVATSTTASGLTQYMNYLALDTTSTIDGFPNGAATYACSSFKCLRLHSGALLMLDSTQFGTTSGFIDVILDPDGKVTSQVDSIVLLVYYNGRAVTYGDVMGASYTPTWFSY